MTYTRLNPSLNDLITTRELTTETQTMSTSNGGKQGNMSIPVVSGYTFVGVLDTECSAWEFPLSKSYATSANWYWAVGNPERKSGSFTIHTRLLYVRDDAL